MQNQLDIDDPDNATNLFCISYLEKRLNDYKEMIKKYSATTKQYKAISEKILIITRNKAMLEAQIENGVVSPEKYKEELLKQKEKDTILSEYFKRIGDDQKQALVELRIAFLQNEINSF